MITIKVVDHGPLRINATDAEQVTVVDSAGNVLRAPNPEKKAISLCRCGQSSKKPFCDGTHKTLPGYVPPVPLVPPASGQ